MLTPALALVFVTTALVLVGLGSSAEDKNPKRWLAETYLKQLDNGDIRVGIQFDENETPEVNRAVYWVLNETADRDPQRPTHQYVKSRVKSNDAGIGSQTVLMDLPKGTDTRDHDHISATFVLQEPFLTESPFAGAIMDTMQYIQWVEFIYYWSDVREAYVPGHLRTTWDTSSTPFHREVGETATCQYLRCRDRELQVGTRGSCDPGVPVRGATPHGHVHVEHDGRRAGSSPGRNVHPRAVDPP
jgi:hypothetical protein